MTKVQLHWTLRIIHLRVSCSQSDYSIGRPIRLQYRATNQVTVQGMGLPWLR